MKKTLKHLELFAGIGGFRRAIDLYCKDNNLIFHYLCINYVNHRHQASPHQQRVDSSSRLGLMR